MDADVMKTAAMIGLHRSFDRWSEHRDRGHDSVRAFPALAEFLWWACAIDESMWSEADYVSRRGKDPDGRVVPGVRWARNRTNHFLALVQADEPPFTVGRSRLNEARLELVELKWERADMFPDGKPDPSGRAVYERHMQGRPVVGTLESVRSWLHRSGVFKSWDAIAPTDDEGLA